MLGQGRLKEGTTARARRGWTDAWRRLLARTTPCCAAQGDEGEAAEAKARGCQGGAQRPHCPVHRIAPRDLLRQRAVAPRDRHGAGGGRGRTDRAHEVEYSSSYDGYSDRRWWHMLDDERVPEQAGTGAGGAAADGDGDAAMDRADGEPVPWATPRRPRCGRRASRAPGCAAQRAGGRPRGGG